MNFDGYFRLNRYGNPLYENSNIFYAKVATKVARYFTLIRFSMFNVTESSYKARPYSSVDQTEGLDIISTLNYSPVKFALNLKQISKKWQKKFRKIDLRIVNLLNLTKNGIPINLDLHGRSNE